MHKSLLLFFSLFSVDAILAMNPFLLIEEGMKARIQCDSCLQAITKYGKLRSQQSRESFHQFLNGEFVTLALKLQAFKTNNSDLLFRATKRDELNRYDYDSEINMLAIRMLADEIRDENARLLAAMARVVEGQNQEVEALQDLAAIKEDIPRSLNYYWLLSKHQAQETVDWAAENKKATIAILTASASGLYIATRLVQRKPVLPWGLWNAVKSMFAHSILSDTASGLRKLSEVSDDLGSQEIITEAIKTALVQAAAASARPKYKGHIMLDARPPGF